ncbi:acyltransferase family protein [Aliarcobacter butzleri]|uniref:acyltransferase family protein n=1 Tax=Aliarcobacter butzleri TaxID=28197 RepID=UPI00125FA761|nr:acyltransferase family protein [Aliarcobacter butzleri]MDK2047654.1 acyltransferase [Aliarcobacter butzleri]
MKINTLYSIQYLRAVAALLVVLYHTYILLVVLVVFTKVVVFGSVSNPQLIYSLTLLPLSNINDLTYPLGVEWTLIYEVFFYFLCSFMVGKFFTSSKKITVMLFWMLLVILYNVLYGEISPMRPTYQDIFLSIYNLSFVIGFLSYYVFKKISVYSKDIELKLIYAVFLTIGVFLLEVWLFRTFDIGLAKIIVVALLNSIMMILFLLSDSGFKKLNVLLNIGNKSYGIYLAHVALITISLSVLHNFFHIVITLNILVLVFGIALLGGYFFGKIDEIFHQFFKYRLDQVMKKKRRVVCVEL